MEKILLLAQGRNILGKKVKNLRKKGQIPGHVFGNKIATENISVLLNDFLLIYNQAGETGLIDLKIGEEKIRPVLIREVQYDPVKRGPLHIDFYQVDLKQKVQVPVPIELIGEEPEKVHLGEVVILQTLNEVQMEALPTDLIEKIEVDISKLINIDDAITIDQLNYDKSKIALLAEPEEIVVKLAPAVTEEMKALLEEQEAEVAAAKTEGDEVKESEQEVVGEMEQTKEVGEANKEEAKEDKVEGEE